jgi:hypothetical protein
VAAAVTHAVPEVEGKAQAGEHVGEERRDEQYIDEPSSGQFVTSFRPLEANVL